MLTLHRSCAVLRIVSGQMQRCEGVSRVRHRVCNSDSVVVDVYVVDFSHWALSSS